MTIGEKIRLARQEAGLSQRQLCGQQVTRNMLSQIENGSARPSVDTLTYFAAQLGKPVSYFLDEDSLSSPNQAIMASARAAYAAHDYDGALTALKNYQSPDEMWKKVCSKTCVSCPPPGRRSNGDNPPCPVSF